LYGRALTAAVERLRTQVTKLPRAHKPSVRKRAATRARKLGTMETEITKAAVM
jgi:hypothetical protein